jgi:hypothetical protein
MLSVIYTKYLSINSLPILSMISTHDTVPHLLSHSAFPTRSPVISAKHLTFLVPDTIKTLGKSAIAVEDWRHASSIALLAILLSPLLRSTTKEPPGKGSSTVCVLTASFSMTQEVDSEGRVSEYVSVAPDLCTAMRRTKGCGSESWHISTLKVSRVSMEHA